MARPEQIPRIAERLKQELGDRLREFPVEVKRDDSGLWIILKGAGGSVTALRGLREKMQPVMKKILREQLLGPRFATVDSTHNGDLHVRVDIP